MRCQIKKELSLEINDQGCKDPWELEGGVDREVVLPRVQVGAVYARAAEKRSRTIWESPATKPNAQIVEYIWFANSVYPKNAKTTRY